MSRWTTEDQRLWAANDNEFLLKDSDQAKQLLVEVYGHIKPTQIDVEMWWQGVMTQAKEWEDDEVKEHTKFASIADMFDSYLALFATQPHYLSSVEFSHVSGHHGKRVRLVREKYVAKPAVVAQEPE